jgi:hypothetical protein
MFVIIICVMRAKVVRGDVNLRFFTWGGGECPTVVHITSANACMQKASSDGQNSLILSMRDKRRSLRLSRCCLLSTITVRNIPQAQFGVRAEDCQDTEPPTRFQGVSGRASQSISRRPSSASAAFNARIGP